MGPFAGSMMPSGRRTRRPLGYRCRCSLISLTEEQAQARSRPNPDGEGTGLYKTPQLEGGIPAKPDKGWDYNPFEDHMQWVNQALERFDPKLRAVGDKMVFMSPAHETLETFAARDQRIRTELASPAFEAFFHADKNAPNTFVVAALNHEDQQIIGCLNDTLLLSRVTLDEHKASHPEVTLEDYRRIPDIIAHGEIWGSHRPQRFVYLWIGNKAYRAAVKSDATGTQAWFLSLVISGKQKPPKGSIRLRERLMAQVGDLG